MARPRKTTETLKLHGQYRTDRHGAPEPAAVGGLNRPADLDSDAQWFWDQHIEQVQANGAGGGDVATFISACEWWSMYCVMKRLITKEKDTDYRTFVKMSMAWKNFNIAASRLGLSPTERAKLRSQPAKKSKLSKFIS
jgi:phage terminase small subunit